MSYVEYLVFFFSSVHEKTLLGNAFFYDNTFSFTSLSFLLGYFILWV